MRSANGPAVTLTLWPSFNGRTAAHDAVWRGSLGQLLHQSMGDGLGLAAAHQQAVDAEGAVDAAPAVTTKIESDEHIARKKRRPDRLKFAGVAAALEYARHEYAKVLIFELPRRLGLAMRLSAHHVPPLRLLQLQKS